MSYVIDAIDNQRRGRRNEGTENAFIQIEVHRSDKEKHSSSKGANSFENVQRPWNEQICPLVSEKET
jgi:hypothetical protein